MIITRDARHRYLVDGQPWEGVTTVLDVINRPALNRYREREGAQEADKVARETADHGTLVHTLAQLSAQGVPYIPVAGQERIEAAELQVAAFRDWYGANVEELAMVPDLATGELVPAVELFVAHPRFRYAGALDFILRIAGDTMWTVVDLKTTADLYREQRAQTAAYRQAALATVLKGERRCRRGVLWLPSGESAGKCVFDEHDRHDADFQAFLSALYIHRWLRI